MELAKFVFHPGDDGGQRQAGVSDALCDEKCGEHAVAFGNEMAESDAAALLAADENVPRQHQIGDVLESDRRLV